MAEAENNPWLEVLQTQYAAEVIERASKIALLVMDVDGVLTTGEIVYTSAGEEIKSFNVKDGQGIAMWNKVGLPSAIITARESVMVTRRARDLGITHVQQQAKPKLPALKSLMESLKLESFQVAYIGDDLPDWPCLKEVGLACCPSDAVAEVRDICHLVGAFSGGRGAVREVTDLILKVQNRYLMPEAVSVQRV